MKLKERLENIAEKSVAFLDRDFYHLSNRDLDVNIPISDDSNFNKLEGERIPYCLQSLAGGFGAFSFWILALTSLAQGMAYAARWFGHGIEGDEILSNKEYTNSLVALGVGIASVYASPLFLEFGEKTMQRFEVLRKKTDDYARMHGMKTATVK